MKKLILVLICIVVSFSAINAGAEYLEADSEYLRLSLAPLLERYEAGEFGDELYAFEAWSMGRNTISMLIYRDEDTFVILEGQYSNYNRWEITDETYAEYKTFITDRNFDAKPKWSHAVATDYRFSISDGIVYSYIHFTPEKKALVIMHEPGALKARGNIDGRIENYYELVAREEKYTDLVELHKWIIDQLHMNE